jgi:hypothetical protein
MTVSLIGWGRFFDPYGNRITVPAPSTDPGKPWLWDLLASEAQTLASVVDPEKADFRLTARRSASR